MKTTLRIMLLATCLASLAAPMRAQSGGEAKSGTSTSSSMDEKAKNTDTRKKEIQDPAGEPKGTNVTGAEKNAEATVNPTGTESKDHQKPGESATQSQK
jgi:hypothetical protein